MAFITADRVKDTSTTTGTGNITVSGSAPFGYRTFSTVLSVADTFYYAIQGQSTAEWEVGLGTYASTNQFARTTVLASSASNSAVSFSSGTKNVFITLPANKTLQFDASGSPTAGGILYGTGSMLSYSAVGTAGQALISGGTGAPTWTTITGLGTVTSVDVSGGTTGLTYSGGPVTTAGTITMAGTLAVANGGTGLTSPGTSGNVLTSNGSAWVSQASSGGGVVNRIINGNMAVDQRNVGTAQTITAAAALAYTVDRWYAYCTGANVTGQQVAGATANQYRYRFTGAASVTAIGFAQRIEAINSANLASTTATLSVDLANSLLTTVTWTAYYANTTDTFGSLASPTVTSIATGTFTVTSTVTRYNAQISIPSGATTGIQILFTVGAQTSGTWTIGNVQLESGSTANPYAVQTYTNQLAQCQRYFAKSFLQGTAPASNVGTVSGALVYTTQIINTQYITGQTNMPVTLRTSPTVTTYNPFTTGSGWSAAGTGSYTANNYSSGDSSIAIRNDTVVTTSGTVMSIHWTVSAEL